MKKLIKWTLLFSVSFLGVLALLTGALTQGYLSPRAFGLALVVLFGVSFAVFALAALKHVSVRRRDPSHSPSVDALTQRRRVLGIRAAKAAIAVLGILLVMSLLRMGTVPLFPLLTGVTMNICTIAVVVWILVRLQRQAH